MKEGWEKMQRKGQKGQDPHSGWIAVFTQKLKPDYGSSMYLSLAY